MSVITFNCPGCQQPIEAPADMAGAVAQCPTCEQEIVVPQAENVSAEQAGNVCSSCGAEMEPGAVLCLQCGYHAGLGRKIETQMQ